MEATTPLVDLAPTLRLALLALTAALLPLAWVWLRQRGRDTRARMAALTALTLFLTFDLIVFGAYTRLSDSGLGCPDWPGCYGEASPFGAQADIHAAQSAFPGGPVTVHKAWVEMIHRYLAMTVGVLILVLAVVSWFERKRLPLSPWWPTATLLWVVIQGLFGKYTVTLKLYPAVVTLHLLGGLFLLALLVLQHEAWLKSAGPKPPRQRLALTPSLRRGAVAVAALLWLQIALGGWVSTNYAVVACTGFPQCNGQWWPAMDFEAGFTLLRELGRAGQGGYLPFDALVAIQMVHRAGAMVLAAALLALTAALWPQHRRYAAVLAGLLLWQMASGLANVVFGWPLAAALAHSAGAAGLVAVSTSLLARARQHRHAVVPVRPSAGLAA